MVLKREENILFILQYLLTEMVDFKIAIWTDKNSVQNIVNKIDLVYKECKE